MSADEPSSALVPLSGNAPTPSDESTGRVVGKAFGPVAEGYGKSIAPVAEDLAHITTTAVKAVKVLLAPVAAAVWGYEKIEQWIAEAVAPKVGKIPEERRIQPPLMIAGPTVEAMRFAGSEAELHDLFATLLATAMDSQTVSNAHPSFVEIIKQLSPAEAKVLRVLSWVDAIPMVHVQRHQAGANGYKLHFRNLTKLSEIAQCSNPQAIAASIDNLCRLGLCDALRGITLTDEAQYQDLIDWQFTKDIKDALTREVGVSVNFERTVLMVTSFGKQFMFACVR